MEKVAQKDSPSREFGAMDQQSASNGRSVSPPPFNLTSGSQDSSGRNGRGISSDEQAANIRWLEGCSRGGDAGNAQPPACTASATGVSLGASTALNNAGSFGLITPITVHGTDLANVLDSELVSPSVDHTGCFSSVASMVSSTSSWMAADNIPPDNHTFPKRLALSTFDANGGAGSISFLQMDLYKIPTCGINSPVAMPNSGYRIKHELSGAVGGTVRAVTTKTAEAVTIDAFTTTAGLTASKRAENTIRP
jgi:hypothetical protein